MSACHLNLVSEAYSSHDEECVPFEAIAFFVRSQVMYRLDRIDYSMESFPEAENLLLQEGRMVSVEEFLEVRFSILEQDVICFRKGLVLCICSRLWHVRDFHGLFPLKMP